MGEREGWQESLKIVQAEEEWHWATWESKPLSQSLHASIPRDAAPPASPRAQRTALGGCQLWKAVTRVWNYSWHLAARWPHPSALAKKAVFCFTQSLSARCRDITSSGRQSSKRQGQITGLDSPTRCMLPGTKEEISTYLNSLHQGSQLGLYVCVCVCVCVCIYMYVHVYMCMCVYIFVYMCVVYMCVCMCVCECVYTYRLPWWLSGKESAC